jgi:hypothetical protein
MAAEKKGGARKKFGNKKPNKKFTNKNKPKNKNKF